MFMLLSLLLKLSNCYCNTDLWLGTFTITRVMGNDCEIGRSDSTINKTKVVKIKGFDDFSKFPTFGFLVNTEKIIFDDVQVKTLPSKLFNLPNLTELDIAGVTGLTMKVSMFDDYPFTKITLPDELLSIPERLFEDNEKITYVKIPKKVASIKMNAFNGCSSLETVELDPNNYLLNILDNAFKGCTKLTNISSLNYLNEIGASAFEGSGITFFEIEGIETTSNARTLLETKTIGSYAFRDCKNLESVIIKDTLEILGEEVFSGCSALKLVTFEGNVTDLGTKTFSECSSLENIYFEGNVEDFGSETFSGCEKLQAIYYYGNEKPTNTEGLKSIPETVNETIQIKVTEEYREANGNEFGEYEATVIGSDTAETTDPDGDGLPAGAIAGIVIAVVVVIALVVGISVYFIRRKKPVEASNENNSP